MIAVCQQARICANNINWHDTEHERFEWALSEISKAQAREGAGNSEKQITEGGRESRRGLRCVNESATGKREIKKPHRLVWL